MRDTDFGNRFTEFVIFELVAASVATKHDIKAAGAPALNTTKVKSPNWRKTLQKFHHFSDKFDLLRRFLALRYVTVTLRSFKVTRSAVFSFPHLHDDEKSDCSNSRANTAKGNCLIQFCFLFFSLEIIQ